MTNQKIAILAVHGVIPQARYGFQDQVATNLCDRLNKKSNTSTKWTMSVMFPKIRSSQDPVASEAPSIVRIHQDEADFENPERDYFDVHEAYWSPLDKGHTNAASVSAWLLRTVFQPINTTARYMETIWKAGYDVGWVLGAMLLGLLFFISTFLVVAWAISVTSSDLKLAACHASHDIPTYVKCVAAAKLPVPGNGSYLADALTVLYNPGKLASVFAPLAMIALIVGGIGAYLLAQALRAIVSVWKQRLTLRVDRTQLLSRLVAILILLILSAMALDYCAFGDAGNGARLGWVAVALIIAMLLFGGGRTLLGWFLTNFFGDVQIYTTHDENSVFFDLRRQILQLVMRALMRVIRVEDGDRPYDRVYVFAHSLGSTISLDALIHIYNMRREGLVKLEEWQRIRGFVTFGSCLEKTKYFFDATNPSFSQQYEEWRNDLYGALFTPDWPSLNKSNDEHCGVFWLNCAYLSDFVCDRIVSYASFTDPCDAPSNASKRRAEVQAKANISGLPQAPTVVAENRWRIGNLKLWHLVTHGDYLGDPWFWGDDTQNNRSALAVVLSKPSPLSKGFAPSDQVDATARKRRSVGPVTRDIIRPKSQSPATPTPAVAKT